jgi:S-(hydroxymethyl)glutathione dehydrogenase/alcohol dehydrogenase
MSRIRAAVCRQFNAPLTIEEVELRAPQSREVEVTLAACAICHSDITFLDGGWGGTLPAVYGHEAAGHVSAVGPGVGGLKVGDPVVVTLIRACGHCPSCAGGAPVLCETPYDRDGSSPLKAGDGGAMHHGLACGAFAEKVVVDQSQVAPIPADMPMDAASLLACGVITGVGAAVNTAQVRPGQSVVVIGAGGVGLNAIQGARISGAARIVAVDTQPEKLEAAREFGATDGVLATDPRPWQRVIEITGRGADACFVAVGAAKAYDTAPRYLKPGGRVYMVGMPHSGAMSSYEPVVVAALGQGMVGTKMGDTVISRDIPWLVDLYRQKRLKLDELITGRWRLDQINEAIADTRSGKARRNVILFG